MKVKVWIVKDLFDKGIIEKEVEDDCIKSYGKNKKLLNLNQYENYLDKEFFLNKKSALREANNLKLSKIVQLKNELIKVKSINI